MNQQISSANLIAQIEARLGFFPPFFEPAVSTPAIFQNLWEQMEQSYLDNPLPDLFKEKLSALMARFCPVSYCLLCHSSDLFSKGMTGTEILELFKTPLFPIDEKFIQPAKPFPTPGSELEKITLACAVGIVLHRDSGPYYQYLKTILPGVEYQYLILLISFTQTCTRWAEAHPELSAIRDRRVETHYSPLLNDEPRLNEFFKHYREHSRDTVGQQVNLLLQNERLKLRELFLQAPVAIAVVEGNDFRYTLANPTLREILGKDDLMGKSILEIFSDAQATNVKQWLNAVYLEGRSLDLKAVPATFSKGDVVAATAYFDLLCQPFLNELGAIVGVLLVVNDVSFMEEAKRIAKESAEQLQAVTQHLPASIAYLDEKRVYQYVNSTYEKWFEKSAANIVGKRRGEFLSNEICLIAAPFEEQVFSGQSAHFELGFHKSDGSLVELDMEYIPEFEPGTRRVKGAIVIGRDISDSKIALREAEKSKQELQQLFKSAPVGICVFEGETHVYALANPTYLNTVFGTPLDVIGKSIWTTLTHANNKAYIGLLDQVYQTGRAFSTKDSLLRVPLGNGIFREIYIHFSLEARLSPEGKVIGVIAVVHEVTEQVLARKKVEQAVQARDDFLSIASHELKTPLTSLQLQTQMMKRNILRDEASAMAPAKIKRLVDQTDHSVQRLTRLVEDMFDISRISTGKLVLNRETFDLSALAAEVVERLAPQIQSAEVKVSVQGVPALGNWDRFRVDQVITNLLTNGMRYGEGSPIEITVRDEGDHFELSVRDYGPGVAPENTLRIFERFERAHSSSSITGLGLGLYISQEIIERHGGTLGVETSVGKGANFVVKLPKT